VTPTVYVGGGIPIYKHHDDDIELALSLLLA
jgi:hypothetical protein